MDCGCGKPEQKTTNQDFPRSVVEIINPEKLILFRKVVIPTSLGDETTVPPVIGKYCNVLLVYESTGNVYLYSSDGIPTKLTVGIEELERQVRELAAEMELKANTADLATVAFTGEYSDLLNEPQDFTSTEWENLWA